ncbi:hypothetical protein K461DRAFT_287213 [Myriangium duriaei CBS 260.36]|uniref:C2H2-type domain-containing protein n=1 Tax=Myriangium duriaei CBS 260.36 TaxID=1168546 RepID=A0A9P4MIV7_9PEZI|nr:hypothetical protein K461DRAFT_287213 [Myriangium duriaei CBS 260.36]
MPTARSRVSSKRFPCPVTGCTRNFSRQEHLQRHSLNHADKGLTCELCRAHFKRPDLLNRHLERHQQKASQGMALMTRKRMWEGIDGQITNASPSSGTPDFTASIHALTALATPPQSSTTSVEDTRLSLAEGSQASYNDTISHKRFDSDDRINATRVPSFQSGTDLWGPTFMSDTYEMHQPHPNGPFEEVFNPDTARSFNMPYTTSDNYDWLFSDVSQPRFEEHPGLPKSSPPVTLESRTAANTNHQHCDPTQSHLHTLATASQWVLQTDSINSHAGQAQINFFPSPSFEYSHFDSQRLVPGEEKAWEQNVLNGYIEYVAAKSEESSHEYPTIDSGVHASILEELGKACPTLPNGTPIQLNDPLLSMKSMQKFLHVFFEDFNNLYPMIHSATFDCSNAQPLLLLSMILLGATYCEKEAHQLAVCIHDILRPLILVHPDFGPEQPPLWILQTILLTECFGKSRAGQKQHAMSHLFHGMLINLIRRSDCQVVVPDLPTEAGGPVQQQWLTWANQEERKRLAQLCFLWDTEHAVLFGQSLCMSAFEMRSSLPCDRNLWDATTAEEWYKIACIRRSDDIPFFLSELRCYFSSSPRRADLNGFSRVLLLHGLMAISWDMDRRDQTSLGLMGDHFLQGGWRLHLKNAYDIWKADFDGYEQLTRRYYSADECKDTPCGTRERSSCLDKFFDGYRALYHAAQIVLSSEVIDLQIYAGARHILGRAVAKSDYARSKSVIRRWLTEQQQDAAHAAWHAACLLSSISRDEATFSTSDHALHYAWVIYLATLTIWTFHHGHSHSESDEMVWDTRKDMTCLIDHMVNSGPQALLPDVYVPALRNPTVGLIAVVARQLCKIRWSIIRDGMLVLRRLVSWRLVNEELH